MSAEPSSSPLPVLAIRAEFELALQRGPVVLTSPTGSGKSTEVPRWCEGRVLVVEPRRLACRSLATRVAELEGSRLGEAVGYVVRDEHVASPRTRIVFATPGMVLRNRALLDGVGSVILDEFHERSLEIDLLLALLLEERLLEKRSLAERSRGLVILSATLEGERVSRHVGGVHLHAPGRAFPVEVRYLPGHGSLPDAADLAARVAHAVSVAAGDAGDILVFLPGKAEIEDCAHALRGPFSLVPLHGGLTLQEQQRAFERTPRRKIILATNVAETSLTVPGVGVVIDAGLVRQTLYQNGRASLTLTPIAEDSAAQRTGRAGRTAPGVCYRLWNAAATLQATTLPEIHRGSLVPLVLTAAAWGKPVESLPLLDPPKPYALEAARIDLRAWGALEGDVALSACGQDLFALPIDPQHARLLVAARREGCLDDMIDLVAVLSVGRPLFESSPRATSQLGIADDFRLAGCDATAAIRAVRAQRPAEHGAVAWVVQEARSARTRLRRAEGLAEAAAVSSSELPIDRDALVRAAFAADPRLAHVARVRGRDVFFGNGGTELELSRESAAQNVRDIEAILALDSRAFGAGRNARVLVTCAMPVPLSALARAGLGNERIVAVRVERRRIVTSLERVYANRVLSTRETTPEGELAQEALLSLLVRGSVFRDAVATTRQRLVQTSIAAWLTARGPSAFAPAAGAPAAFAPSTGTPATGEGAAPMPTLEAWLLARIVSLGLQSGDDLALLSESDFLAPELPYELRGSIENDYPLTVSAGDATYRAEYDLARHQVTLHQTKGSRRDAPALGYLPKFPGLRIVVEGPRGLTVVRARG